ncbi:TonB-dependent receptor [Niabella drilacis]|nr:TonB-dependent receptor [Niabella drilacis]
MKMTIALMLFGSLQLFAAVNAQKISIEKDQVSIKEFLKIIEQKANVEFVYRDAVINRNFRSPVSLKNVPLKEALDVFFSRTDLSYELIDNMIVLKKRAPLPETKAGITLPDNIMVTGVVTDEETQAPLYGATVAVKNTARMTTTGRDGRFQLRDVEKEAVLVISYVGYTTLEVSVAGQQVMAIKLKGAERKMEDLVVIGYGTVKKRDLTGAVAGIKENVLQETKGSSFLNSMQGRVAGLQITTGSGEPGTGSKVLIRGANSLAGSSTPLFVIDGVQVNESEAPIASSRFGKSAQRNPLNSINPADIVSIDVLKDASATAIYGSRGANGVIIVTTRQGKTGEPVISYDGNVGIAYRSKTIEMLNGDEWLDYRKDWTLMPDRKRYEFGYFTDWLFFLNAGERDLSKLEPRDVYALPEYNWQDEMYRTAISTAHNLSVTGGTNYTKYSASLGYNKEQGILEKNDYSRYNMRLKMDHSKNRFRFSLGLSSSYSQYNGAAQSGDGYNNMGILQTALISKPLVFSNPLAVQTQGGWKMPTANLEHVDKTTASPNVSANTTLSYRILNGLYLASTISGTIVPSKTAEFYGKETPWGYYLKGRAAISNASWMGWSNTNSLSYNVAFKNKTKLDVLTAFELNGSRYENNVIVKSNFDDETTGIYDLDKGVIIQQASSGAGLMKAASYLGRVNYSIFNRYLLTASIRADGSDRFGTANRWGYFPSAALAWIASDEPFLKNWKNLESLKFRLSYGMTGNSNIPEFRYLTRMGNAFYGDQLGLIPASMPNPELKWETTTQYNLGMDLSVFGGVVGVTVDLYDKRTTDMLYEAIIPSQSGFKTQWQNLGKINNKGIELSLNTRNISRSRFEWNSSLTFSSNRNRVVDIGNGLKVAPIGANSWSSSYIKINDVGRIMVGQPIGIMYGYRMDGIYQMEDFDGWVDKMGVRAPNDPDIPWQERDWVLKKGIVDPGNLGKARPGTMKFKNLDGSADNKITEADKTIIGRSDPKMYGGIGNNFKYKNVEFGFFFVYALGGKIFNSTKFELEGGFPGEYYNITRDFWNNRWTPDNPTNTRPAYSDPGYYNSLAALPSDYYVEDATFLRLQNVHLSYTISPTLAKKLGVNSCKFYYVADNLFTVTSYSGYTPEVDSGSPLLTGFDIIGYPRATSHKVGVTINF